MTELEVYEPRFHIVLYQPEIPPNTGAIGRTAVALQAKLWLVRPLGFQLNEKTLRRAGLDYWKNLNWQVADNWDQLIRELPVNRHWYFTKTATRSFWETEFRENDALVFGSETSGLPPSILQSDESRNLKIPIGEGVRSLNLSSAVAVAGYELGRQLNFEF